MEEKQIGITAEPEGQTFDSAERELIKKLIDAKKEKHQDLTFESLDDYEIPPRTQFSMLKKPAVTIKLGKLEFNCASVRLFEGITQILPSLSSKRKRLAALPCAEEETSSVEWSRLKQNKYFSKTITSVDYVDKIFTLMEWDRECRYKVLGRLSQSERGLILVFDLTEAIQFAPKPVVYQDTITGKTKKQFVKYYPDLYKYKIGKSYKDYVAGQQQNLFEDLEEYEKLPDRTE